MSRRVSALFVLLATSLLSEAALGQATQPTEMVRFPGVTVDRAQRQIRVECQALMIDAPLEFVCVTNGGPEHESILRTAAKPSHIHAGLLMLGQEPGSPMKFSEAKQGW